MALKRSKWSPQQNAFVLDEGSVHVLLGQPLEQASGDEDSRPFVRAQDLRAAMSLEEPVELGSDVPGADRARHPAADSDARALIDDVVDPQRTAVAG